VNTNPLAAIAGVLLLTTATMVSAASLPNRSHILIVGSSTTYPIVTAAAERIGRELAMQTPVVESTGTGGGIKFFCHGDGLNTPDIAMASRRMKPSEREACMRNKVFDIREIRLGYDGIVIASTKRTPSFNLRQRDIYLALAREVPNPQDDTQLIPNPYRTWRDIDPKLPDKPILVFGPPPTSGTRDMLVERVLEPACAQVPALISIRADSAESFRGRCHALREDGAFVNSGENDARLVRKLIQDDQALAILGYNFLDSNRDRLQAATVDGIAPTFESIETGNYPLTRPLYLYLKPRHKRLIADLEPFMARLLAEDISGPEGFLESKGLIPLIDQPDDSDTLITPPDD
jgi:phosphate transport system substrate-binding protein